MSLRHSALTLSRRATTLSPTIRAATSSNNTTSRSFTWWFRHRDAAKEHPPHEGVPEKEAGQESVKGRMVPFEEVRTMDDLLPPGAEPGTIPTDENQSTGLERLEILGKMQGVDVFDMRPLDASRKGTLEDPIVVNTFGKEQFAGCTGFPADSHWTVWLKMTIKWPEQRCPECGSCYRMQYIGPPGKYDEEGNEVGHGHGHDHGHGHHGEGEPEYDVYRDGHPDLIAEGKKKQWWEYVRPEYHR